MDLSKIISGTHVIVRGDRSGVFFGVYCNRNGREVELKDVRRLWYWSGAASLSELALRGVSRPNSCKFPAKIPSILILDAIEILPTSNAARLSIDSVPDWSSHE